MKNEILEALTIIEEEHNRTKRDIEIIKQAKQEIERLNNIIKQYDKVSFIHEMELQKRIDKAIEYIKRKIVDVDFIRKNYNIDDLYDFNISFECVDDLVKILKGGDEND